MKIGVLARDFVEWAGGLDFLRLIVTATVRHYAGRNVAITLLVPVEQLRIADGGAYAFDREEVLDFFSEVLADITVVFYDDQQLRAYLAACSADVLLPVHTPRDIPDGYPMVGYIYDFQHRYHPERFQKSEILRRDELFSDVLTRSRVVVVNSAAVKRDVARFFPTAGASVRKLPFCPLAAPDWFAQQRDRLRQYGLPGRFFVVCNQFWIHKGHETVIEALADLVGRYPTLDVGLVFTGRMLDRRFIPPTHVERLKGLVHDRGLAAHVRFLGHIPKRDQVEILKESEALIQPSSFEGGAGGGSVYDAVALGVPCVLSDIVVNREVRGVNVARFTTGCARELAARMHAILTDRPGRPSISELRSLEERRTYRLARVVLDAAVAACAGTGPEES